MFQLILVVRFSQNWADKYKSINSNSNTFGSLNLPVDQEQNTLVNSH